jgi:Lecithin retinol acyltransferase
LLDFLLMGRADQIYVMREMLGIPYQHHGIDCGDGTVIHYRKVGEAEIARTSWDAFARGKPVHLYPQSVAFIADVVIERAQSRLGERQYDLFFNNCEHFATWCKTGRDDCQQLNQFGLQWEQMKLPQVGDLARQAAQDESPGAILQLFQQALGNLAIATQTLLPEYQQLQKDVDTWQRVAQKALAQNREDLARAALYRKVEAQKRATAIKAQLHDLSELQRNIAADQDIAKARLQTTVER